MNAEALIAVTPKELFIGGRWHEAASGAIFAVENPATATLLAEVAEAGLTDAWAALASAHDAFPAWRSMPPWARADILRRAYSAMTASTEALALLMTLETGRPLTESRAEVAEVVPSVVELRGGGPGVISWRSRA
ncbi:aldehyde dehydrogenase family protein [Capillimicrobium parvum]|uniref:NAD/NADP-dependent betaine aldehyde dehydrogenase n=1 Tax=Capillimicrobium parvum TaxID=2884022 RepID=A0A9E7C1C3_9ACTN|nr:aldehyde dehydrogenase family protein [Capillimicrobium parvum]UGS36524.1 NAD/NADP-dependent betaine aldehyde dehydrogenase [Capillimicrobium parvum]